MKEGWRVKKLSEVCIFLNGLWAGKKPPFQRVGVIRNTNFAKDGRLDDSDIAYLDVETKQFETRRLQHGDLILEKSGGGPKQAVGRIIMFEKTAGEFSFSNFTAALRVVNRNELDYRYLHYFLMSQYISGITEKMQSHSTGIRNLNVNDYKNIEVPFPSMSEQQHIVDVLNRAFAAIAAANAAAEENRQRALEIFDRYLENVFNSQYLASRNVLLKELATDITDGDHMPPPKANEGVPFITIGNVDKQSKRIDFAHAFRVPRGYYENLKPNRKPHKGDVLYTVTGSYGIPILIEEELEFCFQRHIGLVRPSSETNSKWLAYLLMSPQITRQAREGATGTAQKTVSLNVLRSFKAPMVAIDEQMRTAQRLETIQHKVVRLEQTYIRKLNFLKELQQSTLANAFSGKL